MEITKLAFRGTKEEWAVVQPLFEGTVPVEIVETLEATTPSSTSVHDDIRRILHRNPPMLKNKNYAKLLEVLGAATGPVLRKTLREGMGIADDQLSGVLGPLGTRIHNTPGVIWKKGDDKAIKLFFDTWYDTDEDDTFYEMRPELRQVLEEEGFL